MTLIAIISDTDFLSSFLKIGRLELVKDLFKKENLYIPVAVLGEIAKTDLIIDLLNVEWIKAIVSCITPKRLERAAIERFC